MKKIIVLSVFLLVAFTGCRKDTSISQVHNFTDNTWQRFNFLNFEFQIEEIDKPCDIFVILRYNDDFPSQALLINLVMNLPSGEERIREYKLAVRDDDEKLLGEKKAGYFERIIPIRKKIKFNETGLVKFEIENLMTKYFTPGLTEFGIVLETAK